MNNRFLKYQNYNLFPQIFLILNNTIISILIHKALKRELFGHSFYLEKNNE